MAIETPEGCALVLERILKAPREKIWRCWTEGDLESLAQSL